MEEKHMTTTEDFTRDFGDEDEVLSLCDLPILDHQCEDAFRHSRPPSTSSDQDPFEFFCGLGSELSRSNSVVCCGKIVDEQGTDGDAVNEYRKRDYLCLKSASFRKTSPVYQFNGEEVRDYRSASKNRSSSLRYSSSDLCLYKQRSPVQKVNITAITSMSEKSRRRMFMFGPVKFKPEMDVRAIRMRQGRRPPMQIPPLPEGRELVESGSRGGRRGKSGGDGGLLKPLWCRSHLATALAKSLGCISGSMVL